MKMKSLLFGVILGLFAVVQSTPVNAVTQIPDIVEDDILREVMTDEFLVDRLLFPSLTTEPPKRNTTVQASHQPLSDTESDTRTPSHDMIESSTARETSDKSTNSVLFQHRSEHYATTTPSSTSTVLPDTDDSTSDSSTTQSPQSDFTSSSMPHVDHTFLSTLSSSLGFTSVGLENDPENDGSGMSPESSNPSMISRSNTQKRPTSLLPENGPENEGSGMSPETSSPSMTPSSNTQKRPTSLLPENNPENEGSGMSRESSNPSMTSRSNTEISKESSQRRLSGYPEEVKEPRKVEASDNPDSSQDQGHSTQSWMIILGFVVGVAALVIVCAAIATRDKWNAPKQLETKTNSSHQQMEVEMETFLHNDVPRENGKAAEYTVIPLDDLPEKYSH